MASEEAMVVAAGGALESLSQSERERLEYLEERIAEGLEIFTRVGMDLTEIRDRRLYRSEYGTFEAYCRSRWDLDRAYAYELIGATAITKELSGIPDTPLPTAVSQVRPLKQLATTEERREVWQEAVTEAGGKTPTAAVVKKTVERRNGNGGDPQCPHCGNQHPKGDATCPAYYAGLCAEGLETAFITLDRYFAVRESRVSTKRASVSGARPKVRLAPDITRSWNSDGRVRLPR